MRLKPAPKFHDGRLGAALAVRFKANAKSTRIQKIDREGTVFIDIEGLESDDIDLRLKNFLAVILGVKPAQVDVLGADKTNARLVMILEMTAEDLEKKIDQLR